MATHHDLLAAIDETFTEGIRRGLLHDHAEDDELDGRHLTLRGRRQRNLGCVRLPRLGPRPPMKAAVHEAA